MKLAWLKGYSLAAVGWLLAFAVRPGSSQEFECLYTYTEHPGNVSSCNPYSSLSRFSFKCSVTGPAGFEIAWFHNSQRVMAVEGVINITEVNNTDSMTSILGFIELSNDDYAGQYYCRVMVNGEEALPSDSTMLFGADYREYMNGNACSDIYFSEEANKCANVSVSTPTVTTLPTPSTSAAVNGTTRSPPGTETHTTTPDSLLPSPTLPDTTGPPTGPGTATNTSDPTATSSSSPDLQVWLYVVVAVAAVFFVAIIILSIMCVGLCVRRSKKTDTEEVGQTDGSIKDHFTANGANSMMSNGMYRQPDLTMCTFSSEAQMASPSKSIDTSDYNTLGERDYEVIKVFDHDPSHFDSKQTYQRLQRPSLTKGSSVTMGPDLPSRNGTRHLQSATTLTSAEVLSKEFRRGDSASAIMLPPHIRHNSTSPGSSQAPHEYRTLEEVRDRGTYFGSPTDSSPPDSAKYFEHGDSMTKLIPHSRYRAASTKSTDTVGSNANESLYNPLGSPLFNVLGDIPETGSVFPEPPNPTAFPVPAYDYATLNAPPTTAGDSENTVPRKEPKNLSAEGNRVSVNYETDPKMDLLPTSAMNSAETDNDFSAVSENADFEESITGFTVSPTLESNASADFTAESDGDSSPNFSTPPFPIVSCTPPRAHTADFNKPPSSSQGSRSSPNSLPNFASPKDAELNAKNSDVGLSTLEYEDNDTSSSDFTGPFVFPHMLEKQVHSTSLPHSRQHYYKKLDPSSLDPVVKYTDLQFRGITTV